MSLCCRPNIRLPVGGSYGHIVKTPHVILFVGLPARGKTYMSKKLSRYLNWIGISTEVFNLGTYRRELVSEYMGSDFFNDNNTEAARIRNLCAHNAFEDMVKWFKEKNGDAAVFDATNTTRERRKMLFEKCKKFSFQVLFVESICEDENIISQNISEVKVGSPDYKYMMPERAIEDFLRRIEFYRENYEPLDEVLDANFSFIKIFNVGQRFLVNRVQNHIQSRIVYYLMNTQILHKPIYFCRHGESMDNLKERIGGDSDLSPRGAKFSEELKNYFSNFKELKVWCSSLKRTIQTAEPLLKSHPNFIFQSWKQLNELDAGVCEEMTYEEIEEKFPEEFDKRNENKFMYRYSMGESYQDLVSRLEPIIMELERQSYVLVISHQAVLRCLLAYFLNINYNELPYLKIPLHTIIEISPIAYGCNRRDIPLKVPAVDTHRPKPEQRPSLTIEKPNTTFRALDVNTGSPKLRSHTFHDFNLLKKDE